MKVKIDLPADLSTQVKALAEDAEVSVENEIIDLLNSYFNEHQPKDSFEQRNFVGRKITGNQIVSDDLVAIDGIYYRYNLDDHTRANRSAKTLYTIKDYHGNLVILHRITQKRKDEQ